MLKPQVIVCVVATILCCTAAFAQSDSTLAALEKIPGNYVSTIDKKIDKYTNRISSKNRKNAHQTCQMGE